jgi:hypothetical protein
VKPEVSGVSRGRGSGSVVAGVGRVLDLVASVALPEPKR